MLKYPESMESRTDDIILPASAALRTVCSSQHVMTSWWSNPVYAHGLHSIHFCLENLLQRVTKGTGFYAGDTQRWTNKHSGAHSREDRWRGPAQAQGCLGGGRGKDSRAEIHFLWKKGRFSNSTKEPCVCLAVLDWGADVELINTVR